MPQVTLVLETHIAYTAWASAQLLYAAYTLSPQDLQHDFGTADRTIPGTLSHIFVVNHGTHHRGQVSGFIRVQDILRLLSIWSSSTVREQR